MSRSRNFQVLTLALLLMLSTLSASGADFGNAMGLYMKGDYAAALKEFTILAGQGHADSQFVLGDMYAQGQGVTQDNVQAYKWYEIASHNGANDAPAARDALKTRMSTEDVTRAQQLAQEWRPDKVAAEGGAAPPPPPSPPPATPSTGSSGGFFSNLARSVTGMAGGPGAASNTSTSVSGVRGILNAQGMRSAKPDMDALQKMEGYSSNAGDIAGFAQKAALSAQDVPYLEIQTESASSQPASAQPLGPR